jgi:ribosomal protein S18 acetylase RimI-like enzyme
MKITSLGPSKVDFKELAAFIGEHKATELKNCGLSLTDFEHRLKNVWPFISYILARQAGKLIGYALLYQIGDSKMIEINPGEILGYHPFVAPGYDENEISSALIVASKESIVKAGFDSLYIDIPWNPAEPAETYAEYHRRYGRLGFEVIQLVHKMNVDLPVEVGNLEISEGIALAQIQFAETEALYQCHHAAYLQGDAQYYFQVDDDERKDDFNRVYSETVRAHPASLVLTSGDQVIGYVMLFAEGDFTEVMSLAVHPEFRRKGYGRLLMMECLKRAGENEHKLMHLIVDEKNLGARKLYQGCGFKVSGGNMTFKWKRSS